ncbi:FAD-binding oxidoreductase [Brevibacterium sp. JNUCC-42]|nr:FAD-binding oxidoreductase [Brevibacterium sp. JNUCC-42]
MPEQPKTKLTGRIVFPGDPGYQSARQEYNRRFNKFPRVIVFCQRTQDIINAVKWARERKVPIRIRSGRHSYEGFSAVTGGIIIDVSEMNKIRLDHKRNLAYVQTGAQLGELYQQLWKNRVTVPAGTAADVGVAGLTLGGGIGLLSRQYGLTLDHLQAVNMIVASGKKGAKLIKANPKQHSDLLWASKGGGGGNFGIASSYALRVRPIHSVSIYSITWRWKDFVKVFDKWQRWAPSVTDRLTSTIEMSSKQVGKIVSTGQLLGSAEELRRLIKPLLDTGSPIKIKVQKVPYIKAVKFFAESDENLLPKFKITGAYAYKNLPIQGIKVLQDFLGKTPNRHSTVWCQSLGGAVSRLMPSETAYFHRGARYIFELSARWRKNTSKPASVHWVNCFREALTPYVIGDYVNFPDLHIKDWPQAYYGTNFARLKRIKQKYDPHNVFRFAQSIPVKNTKIKRLK